MRKLVLLPLVAFLILPALALAAKPGYYASAGGELRVSGTKIVALYLTCAGAPDGPTPGGTNVIIKKHLSISSTGRFAFTGAVKLSGLINPSTGRPLNLTIHPTLKGVLTAKKATIKLTETGDAPAVCKAQTLTLRYYGNQPPMG